VAVLLLAELRDRARRVAGSDDAVADHAGQQLCELDVDRVRQGGEVAVGGFRIGIPGPEICTGQGADAVIGDSVELCGDLIDGSRDGRTGG
jgi:hypothetical protein